MKKMIQNIVLGLVFTLGFSFAFAGLNVEASPFSGSKGAACEGVGAGTGGACDQDKLDAGTTKVSNTINKIVNILTIIVGIVAVILIIVNGFRFITSGGDSNAVSAAKNGMIYAIVGLIIVALAQVIVKYVINKAG